MRKLSDGRLRRSREEWQEIISRLERSGQSENAFCRRHGLNRKTLRIWRQRFGAEAPRGPAFVELAMPSAPELPETVSLYSGSFEIALPGGVVVRWKP